MEGNKSDWIFARVLYVLESDHIIAGFDIRYSRTDALNNASSFVAEHDGKCALGIFPAESIGICVAEAIVVDANSNLVRSGRSNLDFLDAQVLASGPSNGGFAGDRLAAGLNRIVHRNLAAVCSFADTDFSFFSMVFNELNNSSGNGSVLSSPREIVPFQASDGGPIF